EHIIMTSAQAKISNSSAQGLTTIVHSYPVAFEYDSYPSEFMFSYALKYGDAIPGIQVDVIRPDGKDFQIYSSTPTKGNSSGIIQSTDPLVAQGMRNYLNEFSYLQDPSNPQTMIFSDSMSRKVLKGTYIFKESFIFFEPGDSVTNSGLIVGGKVFG